MEYHKCRMCQNKYEEMPNDKLSNKPDKYIKAYLGFCTIKCWNKLSDKKKAHEKMILAIHGTTRKQNHYTNFS